MYILYMMGVSFVGRKNESSRRKSLNTRDQQNLSHKVHVQRSPNCQDWHKSIRLVFCNRKLIRTDIFFTRTIKPISNFINPACIVVHMYQVHLWLSWSWSYGMVLRFTTTYTLSSYQH